MKTETAQLLMHPRTAIQAQAFINQPAHALILVAPQGSGKLALAKYLAASILSIGGQEALGRYPYFWHLSVNDSDKREIPIESVRQLIKSLKLRTPGGNSIRRVVLIEDAQNMSAEAQNALLKLLEEPGLDTVFLLTITSEHSVLPTISSRAQSLQVLSPSRSDVEQYFQADYDKAKIEQAWLLSGGQIGTLQAILTEDDEHPLKIAIDQAKVLLGQTRYERLAKFDQLSKDKAQLALILEALQLVFNSLYRSQTAKNNTAIAKKTLRGRKLAHNLQTALEANASARLVALQLLVQLEV